MLLLDEPLSALDSRTRAYAGRELVAALRDARALAIVVTHDFSEAALLADQIFVMDDGRIVQRGTAASSRRVPQAPSSPTSRARWCSTARRGRLRGG